MQLATGTAAFPQFLAIRRMLNYVMLGIHGIYFCTCIPIYLYYYNSVGENMPYIVYGPLIVIFIFTLMCTGIILYLKYRAIRQVKLAQSDNIQNVENHAPPPAYQYQQGVYPSAMHQVPQGQQYYNNDTHMVSSVQQLHAQHATPVHNPMMAPSEQPPVSGWVMPPTMDIQKSEGHPSN